MNNGLPSLLDAIFGKQDLASVTLEEMYEVINEFPSFNAAHYLLAKKLKEQKDAAYDYESRRTALYFNNAFWLQTLLEDGNRVRNAELNPSEPAREHEKPALSEHFFRERSREEIEEEPDEEAVKLPDEQTEAAWEHSPETFPELPLDSETVSSFDELISKYKIDAAEVNYNKPEESATDNGSDEGAKPPVYGIQETESGPSPELHIEIPETPVAEPESFHTDEKWKQVEMHQPTVKGEEFETREEVVNEYGIFEEVVVKKTDYDLEAFDRPVEEIPDQPEVIAEQTVIIPPPAEQHSAYAESISTRVENEQPSGEAFLSDTEQADNSTIVENPVREDTPDKTDEHDYDSFDRPLEEAEQPETETEGGPVFSEGGAGHAESGEDTVVTFIQPEVQEEALALEMQGLADRIDEHRKAVAVFDAKNADSIVFAPYHMIDYFASQGIKLVLEDNPADNLGKQLKSFTDWLKVMKKIPAQAASDKTDEREADRIRHIAAHSIEDRDILTESMAEVLAKQGMYENAIALFQKLSLIYPPKSAYFASRIEQLKASLP